MEQPPAYDNHFHMRPDGRNVEAVREFAAAGGTGITLVTLPYDQVPIACGDDFAESYEITYRMARMAEEAGIEVNVAVGPYPVLIVPLAGRHGAVAAEEMMVRGMEAAAEAVAEGKAVAIGEVGRPHFDAGAELMEASDRILLRGMELARELDVPVIIHCESGDTATNRSLRALADEARLDPGLVVKHSSPPFVTDEETCGILPSMPASRSNIAAALAKGSDRFLLETDYIDDPARPTAVMAPATVPRKVRQMLASGMADLETVERICRDLPGMLYRR